MTEPILFTLGRHRRQQELSLFHASTCPFICLSRTTLPLLTFSYQPDIWWDDAQYHEADRYLKCPCSANFFNLVGWCTVPWNRLLFQVAMSANFQAAQGSVILWTSCLIHVGQTKMTNIVLAIWWNCFFEQYSWFEWYDYVKTVCWALKLPNILKWSFEHQLLIYFYE